MFAYCNNNPVNLKDYSGYFAISALVIGVIAIGGVIGGLTGAFSAACTGGNIVESTIEGCITGTIGSACGILIANPLVAIGTAFLCGTVVDVTTQVAVQCIMTGEAELSNVDMGRSLKTGGLTALGTAIPQFGEPAKVASDAFGTALIWAEGSVLIACTDVIASKCSYDSSSLPGAKTTGRSSLVQVSILM